MPPVFVKPSQDGLHLTTPVAKASPYRGQDDNVLRGSSRRAVPESVLLAGRGGVEHTPQILWGAVQGPHKAGLPRSERAYLVDTPHKRGAR